MQFEFTKAYQDHIRSDRWKLICARYWALYGRRCQACGARDRLHVHHVDYSHFGRESMADLRGLCSDCHKQVHAIHRKNRSIDLRLVTDSFIKQRKRK